MSRTYTFTNVVRDGLNFTALVKCSAHEDPCVVTVTATVHSDEAHVSRALIDAYDHAVKELQALRRQDQQFTAIAQQLEGASVVTRDVPEAV